MRALLSHLTGLGAAAAATYATYATFSAVGHGVELAMPRAVPSFVIDTTPEDFHVELSNVGQRPLRITSFSVGGTGPDVKTFVAVALRGELQGKLEGRVPGSALAAESSRKLLWLKDGCRLSDAERDLLVGVLRDVDVRLVHEVAPRGEKVHAARGFGTVVG